MTATTITTTTTTPTMKAAILHKNGDATTSEVLSVETVDIPKCLKGEILVRVKAAAINPLDWKFWNGSVPGKSSGLVGLDVSGIVHEIGPDTKTSLKIGDAIYACALTTQGSFAEYCRVSVEAASPKPSNLSFVEAASLPLVGLTALQGLVTYGTLQEGQTVCILGGSGGVGSLAISMAKAMGASHIYATGSSVDMIQKLGADTVINYKEVSIVEALKNKEIDLILDCVGGYEQWEAAQGALKNGGRFISIVGDGGSMIQTITQVVWRKFVSLFGVNPSYHIVLINVKAPDVVTDMAKITELVESGKLKPVLEDTQYQLTTESVHELVKASMSNRAKGKLVLVVEE